MDTLSLTNMILGAVSITLALAAIAISFLTSYRSQQNYMKTLEALTAVDTTSVRVQDLVGNQYYKLLEPMMAILTEMNRPGAVCYSSKTTFRVRTLSQAFKRQK
jgi:hypothetical protein